MLTAKENIVLPLSIAGDKPERSWVDELTARSASPSACSHRPVGALRRAAAARRDRPGARLEADRDVRGRADRQPRLATSAEILALLRESVTSYGQTTVMVTHDAHAAAIADRILFLADGLIVKDLGPSTSHEILDALQEVTGR